MCQENEIYYKKLIDSGKFKCVSKYNTIVVINPLNIIRTFINLYKSYTN